MQNDMNTLLDDMRDAVVVGNYGKLSELLPALTEAEKLLQPQSMAEMAALRARAAQNAACMDAAISGIKSARRRLTEIAKAEAGLTTYDREGGKATLSSAQPKSRRV
jgi:predicted oxidoreductase